MPRQVLGIVDSDSFVKWGANLLARAPEQWEVDLVSISTPASASATQLATAVTGVGIAAASVASLTLPDVLERIRVTAPDAVLVSTLGPVAEVLISELSRMPDRPVIVTGLPGISIPPKWKGLFLRAQADVFVLHSRREVAEYTALACERGVEPNFALATLPFLAAASATPRGTADTIVFAAQPSVPALREDREAIVGWLTETARAHPHLRVVIKTRARAGEKQTHHEEFPYAALLPLDAPPNLLVEGGPMAAHLARAVGLVTVSSTAVVEAIACGVPSLVLTDFGVERRLINEVFEASGLQGTADDLIAARFFDVRDDWRDANYFHPSSADDWAAVSDTLMSRRDLAALPPRTPARRSRGGSLRRAWERKIALGPHDRSALGFVALVVGMPIRIARRATRRMLGSQPAPGETATPTPAPGPAT